MLEKALVADQILPIISMWPSILGGLFLLTLVMGSLSIVYWTIKNGISPMPTSSLVAAELLSALPENIDGPIYELGAGWGTLAFPLAKKYPLNHIKAFENSLVPYCFCCLRKIIFPQQNLSFYRSDFFKSPLNDASLVICYLFPKAMSKLKPKINLELQPCTLIVSNTFSIPGLKPLKIIELPDIYHSKIYIYSI